MPADPFDVSYFAETDARAVHRPFGIRQADRLLHTYIIGKTGVGKSTLLKILARQDMEAGRGFAVLDPHGDLVEALWAEAPPAVRDRFVYLDAADLSQPYGYNPLRRVRDDRIPLAASGLLETLRKLWPTAWGVRMEHVLRNSLFALMELPNADLTDILLLYEDKKFRAQVARELRNPIVKAFWTTEFENYPPRLRAEAIAPIQNKLGALLADPRVRRVLVAPQIDLHFRAMMDEGRGLLVNLARGRLGEDASAILGGFIASTIGLAAFTRAEIPEAQRRPFYLYADEFQSFTTLSFVNMMAELRKYGVGLILAHQHLDQLEPAVRHSVFGNAGTLISFRVGAEDAPLIASEFQPIFKVGDLLNLPNRKIFLKLMVDDTPSRPFSAQLAHEALIAETQPRTT